MPDAFRMNAPQTVQSLPLAVRDFIFDPDDTEGRRIVAASALGDRERLAFFALVRKTYLKALPVTDLYAASVREAGIPEEKARPLVRDFIGYRFLPIDDYLGGTCTAALKALGTDPAHYPVKRITVRTMTPSDVVAETLREHPVNVSALLEPRLRDILESRVRGVRKDEETVQRLTRAEKIGGVALDFAEAAALVARLVEKTASVRIGVSVPPPSVITPPTPSYLKRGEEEISPAVLSSDIKIIKPTAVTAASAGALGVVSKRTDAFSAEDAAEADRITATILPNVVPASVADTERDLNATAVRIVDTAGLTLPRDLSERFRTLILARLKDVRDAAETRDLLSREVSKGGMGFGDEVVNRVMDTIEGEGSKLRKGQLDGMQKEKVSYVDAVSAQTLAKEAGRKQMDEDELDRMYSAITGKGSGVQKTKDTAPSVPVATPSIRQGTVLPTMHDVRRAAPIEHLTGPIEELRTITLDDFRRLSADPAESLRKLNDKLVLLEEQSYAKRIEGVKAWQDSPVNKLYLAVIEESFGKGKTIVEVLRVRQSSGALSLTEREVHAIMQFNRTLKF